LSKVITALKVAFYLVVIGGAAAWGWTLYETRGEWSYRLAGRPTVSYVPPYTLRVDVPLEVYDPAGPVMAKLVYYNVYINGEQAGTGLIPYISLHKGWNNLTVTVNLDLSRISCGLAHALANGENLTVTVKGYAMIDIKTLGGLTWRTITVPYSIDAKQVQTPQIGQPARALLKIYDTICTSPSSLASQTGQGIQQGVQQLINSLQQLLNQTITPTPPTP
jgi:hypothetical protein